MGAKNKTDDGRLARLEDKKKMPGQIEKKNWAKYSYK